MYQFNGVQPLTRLSLTVSYWSLSKLVPYFSKKKKKTWNVGTSLPLSSIVSLPNLSFQCCFYEQSALFLKIMTVYMGGGGVSTGTLGEIIYVPGFKEAL